MNTYYIGSMPVTNELYHFGIKGQKWGIRRYQNPDGTLTEEGKRRYGKGVSKNQAFKNFLAEDKKTQIDILSRYSTLDMKTIQKHLAGRHPNVEALLKDFSGVQEKIVHEDEIIREGEKVSKAFDAELAKDDFGGYTKGHRGWGMEPPSKRYADAADTGLNAMEKLGLLNFDYKKDNNGHYDNYTRDWFVWEDQTIGLADISDLVNRGKSKKQIIDYIDRAYEIAQKYTELSSDSVFKLSEARNQGGLGFLSAYIDNCIESKSMKHGMELLNSYGIF